ncbi:CLUMA_CG008441, isoform A [Clunio marinus]|uniref:CLUMA_CG008441, isoform A n=1 Tax=Clunio marinus TaxID=568069 RepID=A0A1J1I946_9DIPT|nr:CLUMA_CG008441, isoform A [Clunio marinus]
MEMIIAFLRESNVVLIGVNLLFGWFCFCVKISDVNKKSRCDIELFIQVEFLAPCVCFLIMFNDVNPSLNV